MTVLDDNLHFRPERTGERTECCGRHNCGLCVEILPSVRVTSRCPSSAVEKWNTRIYRPQLQLLCGVLFMFLL